MLVISDLNVQDGLSDVPQKRPESRMASLPPPGDVDAREVALAALGPTARQLRREVEDATAAPIFIDYHLAPEWFEGVSAAIDDIEQVIEHDPLTALLLAEHAIERLEASGIDDSDGWLSQAIPRLEKAHAAACQAAAIAPLELARRLQSLAARSDFDAFDNAPDTHRDALGPAGLRALGDPPAGA